MSQAPNPFTQAASQGYGDFTSTLDDEDQDENNVVDEEEEEDQHQQQLEDDEEEELEGPQSPEPEEHEINELGFTQTQERSYPTGIESPDEDENEGQNGMSDNEQEQEQEQEDDNNEEVEPSSPQVEEENEQQEVEEENEQQEVEEENEKNDDDDDEDHDTNQKQSQSQQRRRVQIMDDSDNEAEEEQPIESTSVVSKDKNRHFLKQFTMKNDDSHKKHKKRHSDEHQHRHDHKSKRFRKTSNDNDDDEDNNTEEPQEKNTDIVEATSDVEDVVDDIFGKDVNDNEEEGNDQEEVAAELAELNDDNEVVREEEEEEEGDEQQQTFDTEEGEDEEASARKANYSTSKNNNIGYDIDLYLEKKAEKRRGNRRRGGKNGDIDLAGPDGDQLVSKLIDQMKIATEEDRIFNKSRQPATAKLLLLPTVEQQLCRADLTEIFLDNGILNVFKDWLSPLPDKSLPNIKIRESLIKILQQFGVINADPLRDSGIGKALMYLYKHPRETKENKIKLIKIIHDWARPIFNLDTDYKLLTREERQQRDVDQASLKRQTSLTGKPKNRRADVDLPFASDRRQDDDDELNKDDDCPRARVPRPSNKDYVVRPVSAVEYSDKRGDGKKRTISRLDAIKRRQQDRKRNSKPMSIVKLSIEGNKMHL